MPLKNRSNLPVLLVLGDTAYFKKDGEMYFVMGTRPLGFLVFELAQAVKWLPSDEDSIALRDLIMQRWKI